MTETESEEGLMAAYVAGDRLAFGRLFDQLAPRLHAFFVRSFRDRSVADELTQETFLRIHRGRSQFRTDLKLRPWVFTIASNVRKDELRRRYRVKEDCDEEGLARAEAKLAFETAAQTPDEGSDRLSALSAALGQLPESQRVILQLHRFEGLSFREVASILGTTEVAARGRAFRAYEQLRKALAPKASPPTENHEAGR